MLDSILKNWKTSTVGAGVLLALAISQIWFPAHATQIGATSALIAASALFAAHDPKSGQ